MFRSLSIISILAVLSACSTLDPLTESPFPSSEENCDDSGSTETGTETGDTAEVEDTGSDTSEEIDEPCTVSVQWSVESPVVSVDEFIMPRLDVSTTCTSPTAVGAIEIYFSSDRWLEQIGDTRLGVGTEYEHLGVYSATELKCQQDRCGAMWDIDPTSYSSAYPTSDYTVSFGFSLASFASGDVAEIDELWDEEGDEVILTAVVGEIVAQTTITIVAE